jgi:hypothetical protein
MLHDLAVFDAVDMVGVPSGTLAARRHPPPQSPVIVPEAVMCIITTSLSAIA